MILNALFPLMQDTIILGLLLAVLALIFYTSSSQQPFFRKLYRVVPPILLCYLLPAFLRWPLGIISLEESVLYTVSSRYLLPASLILFCLSIDLKSLMKVGNKALIIFLTATLSIVLGGPLALYVSMHLFGNSIGFSPDELWRGLSTIAGSWIGGGANQTAMKEIFEVDETIFGTMVVVDIVVANIWMGVLLYGATITKKIDKWLKADTSAIDELAQKAEQFQRQHARMPSTLDYFIMAGIAFGGVSMAHLGAEIILPWLRTYETSLQAWRLDSMLTGFFWLIVIATTYGLLLSFTKAKNLEGVGASKFGSVFLYILVATIGMQMNLKEMFSYPALLLTGVLWMLFHILILLTVARLIKAPFFFVAVGSQANIGGAASAPIVASAFNPALATIGVLMAVLGYALGTYGGILSAFMMRWVSE
jgi:uncharacterized membrane protein